MSSSSASAHDDTWTVLNSRVNTARDKVYELVSSHYDQFSTSYSNTAGMMKELDDLDAKLKELDMKINGASEGLKAVHDKQKQQVDKINNDVKLREKLVELLRIISEDPLISKLRELSTGNNVAEPRIVKIINKEYTFCYSRIKTKLTELFRSAIVCTSEGIKIQKYLVGVFRGKDLECSTSFAQLLDISMEYGIGMDLVIAFGHDVSECILKPLLDCPFPREFMNKSKESGASRIVCTPPIKLIPLAKESRIVVDHPADVEVHDADMEGFSRVTYVYDQIVLLLSFLKNEINVNPEAHELLFNYLVLQARSRLLENVLRKSIPLSTIALSKYDVVLNATVSFEKILRELGSVEGNEDEGELVTFTKQYLVHYAEQKRSVILERARNIALSSLHDSVVAPRVSPNVEWKEYELSDTGKTLSGPKNVLESVSRTSSNDPDPWSFGDADAVFSTPAYRVPWKILELCHLVKELLEESIQTTSKTAGMMLYRTARDVVSLYVAVAPHSHNTVGRTSLLLHNSLMYLSYMCSLWPIVIRDAFVDPVLSQLATFADMIPPIRKSASAVLMNTLRSVRESANDLDYLDMSAICKILSSFSRDIVEVCSLPMYCYSMGWVCEGVVSKNLTSMISACGGKNTNIVNIRKSANVLADGIGALFKSNALKNAPLASSAPDTSLLPVIHVQSESDITRPEAAPAVSSTKILRDIPADTAIHDVDVVVYVVNYNKLVEFARLMTLDSFERNACIKQMMANQNKLFTHQELTAMIST